MYNRDFARCQLCTEVVPATLVHHLVKPAFGVAHPCRVFMDEGGKPLAVEEPLNKLTINTEDSLGGQEVRLKPGVPKAFTSALFVSVTMTGGGEGNTGCKLLNC